MNLNNTSVHKLNISLAIQLSMDWLIRKGILPENHNRTLVTKEITSGIEKFNWPGRYQVIKQGESRFFLDGAHTLDSIEACLEWFRMTSQRPKECPAFRCLIFYVTGQRDVESLATPILKSNLFDLIIICPNVVDTQATIVDNVNAHSNSEDIIKKCHSIRDKFINISGESVPVKVLPSVCDSLKLLDEMSGREKDVLITGSLYLVGTALIALKQGTTN